MENKEYTPGQNRPGRRGGMRGPGMGRGFDKRERAMKI